MADKTDREKDMDVLFAAPLAEFTNLRNTLASRLKKAGFQEDAEKVRAIAKPSITAWAVNQLFFEHRDLFDNLRAAGARLTHAQFSQIAGKAADVRSALDERRNVLGAMTGRALARLEASGHAATPEATRRISATLEAISVASPGTDGETPGRLTADRDPPGFDALSMWMPNTAGMAKPSKDVSPKGLLRKSAAESESDNQARRQALKNLLRQAESALAAARNRVKKAEAALADAQMRKRDADEELDRVRVAAQKANAKVQELTREANEAKKALQQAEAGAATAVKEAERI